MRLPEKKKLAIRTKILDAASVYSEELAGKVFLYVVGDKHFEVAFPVDRFKHLTGTKSSLSAKDFYKKAKKATLTTDQIFFDKNHPYNNAKKKLGYLELLPAITSELVCVVKNLKTPTITYKLGVTNLSFTIGLIQSSDDTSRFIPMTLRINDKAIENSTDAEFVDFILGKSAEEDAYTELRYKDPEKVIPVELRELLSKELQEQILHCQD